MDNSDGLVSDNSGLKIVVTTPLSSEQFLILRAIAPEAIISYYPDDAEFCLPNPSLDSSLFEDAEIVLGDVPANLLGSLRHLNFIQTGSAGVGEYLEALPESVMICNATGAYSLGISEALLTMTFMLKRRMLEYLDQQKAHVWNSLGHVGSIHGSVLLSIGLGSVGSEFAQKSKQLGAYTIGVRRSYTEKPDWLDELHMIEKIEDLLPRADIVALTLPETAATKQLFNAHRLSLMKKNAILLNVGRGSAIDTNALDHALRTGVIAGAGLDVVDPEPLPAGHPLWDAPNVIITPHVSGGYTLPQTLEHIGDLVIENLRRYLAGEPLLNQVNRSTGYAKPEGKYKPN